jgi:hypothetical protein
MLAIWGAVRLPRFERQVNSMLNVVPFVEQNTNLSTLVIQYGKGTVATRVICTHSYSFDTVQTVLLEQA